MVDLKGMPESSPISFLAALGLLRVLTEEGDHGGVTLRWANGHAVLDGVDSEEALSTLLKVFPDRVASPEFGWADTTRVDVPTYRTACEDMAGNDPALAFMAGWGTDAVVRDGKIANTLFDMTGARQQLLRGLRTMGHEICERGCIDDFRSAMFGGPYRAQSSFGLDPAGVRSHALEARAPTKSTPPGKPALIWLAFESVPLHPVLPVDAGRAVTTGWRRDENTTYVWATWETPLPLDVVRLLRLVPVEELPARPGIGAIWASRRISAAKYLNLLSAVREH